MTEEISRVPAWPLVFPLFWDIRRGKSTTQVFFPFYMKAHRELADHFVFLNLYYRRGLLSPAPWDAAGTAPTPRPEWPPAMIHPVFLERAARRKLGEKNLDLIVVNEVGRAGTGFGSETNRAAILAATGEDVPFRAWEKAELAAAICDRLEAALARP